ncbi:MAG: cysteine desulfurase [Alphaproteobacteria bacterium]|nr:cysteine desulfurase [Alphaproteobacteria bacterium]MBV9377569.1 cysteine desulfurase [Alphaproteobacteria bacterium]
MGPASLRSVYPGPGGFDPKEVKREFPIFANNPDLVFLDSAASAQKPRSVIDGTAEYYRTDYANVHRGVYRLSARSTERYEEARDKVRRFLNASDRREIVFVRNTTEAINLVAQSWGAAFLREGDEVVISELEHHSNIVPWQLLRDRIGIKLVVAPIDATGGLDLAAFETLLSRRTRLVAVTHMANATGALVPVERVVALAHRHGAKVLLDGSQAAPRLPVDVQALGCDFYAFTGHKVYGPTGIGVLYGRFELLSAMPPYQGGGEMILHVSFDKTEYQEPPHRFEAGTPDIAGAIGLGIALDFIEELGRENIREHEEALTGYGVDRLAQIRGLRLLGAGQRRLGILSFDLEGVHPHDVSQVLDQHHVAVRAGHHCAQPLMEQLGLSGTTRASLGVYNDEADIDRLAEALKAAREMFLR